MLHFTVLYQDRLIIYSCCKEVSLRGYILSFKVICPVVLEQRILKFFPYMGTTAILVMLPRPNIENSFLPLFEGCGGKLIEIGQKPPEGKSFEDVNGRRADDGQRRLPSYKLPRSTWLRRAKLENR